MSIFFWHCRSFVPGDGIGGIGAAIEHEVDFWQQEKANHQQQNWQRIDGRSATKKGMGAVLYNVIF